MPEPARVTKDSTIILTKAADARQISARVVEIDQLTLTRRKYQVHSSVLQDLELNPSAAYNEHQARTLGRQRRRSEQASNGFTTATLSRTPGETKAKKRKCCCCGSQLGRFFHTGASCPSCARKTCSDCRVRIYLDLRKKSWLCQQCIEERQTSTLLKDYTARRRTFLRRAPVSLVPVASEIQTLQRNLRGAGVPVSRNSSSKYSETLPRHLGATETEEPLYAATKGRPVMTSANLGGKTKKLDVSHMSFTLQNMGRKSRSTAELNNVSPPSKQVMTLDRLRKIKMGVSSMATLTRPAQKMKPAGQPRESYVSVDMTPMARDPIYNGAVRQQDPKTMPQLNGFKSATIDRVPIRKREKPSEFSLDLSTESTSTASLLISPSRSAASSASPPAVSSATLPRASRKIKREESFSIKREPIVETPSLLNVAQKSGTDALTNVHPELRSSSSSGICHPSFAVDRTVFSRQSFHRKSFMGRGSMRAQRPEHPLDRVIADAITMQYDDFLAVVQENFQTCATYHMKRANEPFEIPKKAHVSVVEIAPQKTDNQLKDIKSSLSNRFSVEERKPEVHYTQVHFILTPGNTAQSNPTGILLLSKELHVSSFVPEDERLETNVKTLGSPPKVIAKEKVVTPETTPKKMEVELVEKVEPAIKQPILLSPNETTSIEEMDRIKPTSIVVVAAAKSTVVSGTSSPVPPIRSPMPKPREVKRPAPPPPSQTEDVPEFVRVLQKLKETKKPAQFETEKPVPVDDTQTSEEPMNKMKQITEEVTELKHFLQDIKRSSPTAHLTPPPVPKARKSISPAIIQSVMPPEPVTIAPPEDIPQETEISVLNFSPELDEVSDEDVTLKAPESGGEEQWDGKKDDDSGVMSDFNVEQIPVQSALAAVSTEDTDSIPEDETPSESDVEEVIPAKKCKPTIGAVLQHDSSEDEETLTHTRNLSSDEEEESTVKSCRKAENSVENEKTTKADSVATSERPNNWLLDLAPDPNDLFGRLQVPLFTIDEETEDEGERLETTFAKTLLKRIRPMDAFEFTDDEDELVNWESDEESPDTQSDLEKYFTDGLSQITSRGKMRKVAEPLSDDEGDQAADENEEPSIFKSARLRFVSTNYRLSSDNSAEDLSDSVPSDEDDGDFYQ